MELTYEPTIVRAGTVVDLNVTLRSREAMPLKRVILSLDGTERVQRGGRALIHHHIEERQSRAVRTLPAGATSFPFRFSIPSGAPPSYVGMGLSVSYPLGVHVDIPWWPDWRGRFPLPVRPAIATPPDVKPSIFCTSSAGPQRGQLYIEASLDTRVVVAGGALTGRCALQNARAARVRGVRVELVAQTRDLTSHFNSASEVQRHVVGVFDGTPEDGQTLPFRVQLPRWVPPAFRGALGELTWSLFVIADVAWGVNVSVEIPVTVVNEAPAERAAPLIVEAPVGRERRLGVWAHVARQHALDHDERAEQLSATFGRVTLRLACDARGKKGTFLVAALSWPPLGLGLEAGEPRLFDAPAGHPRSTGDRALDKRLRARGRDPEQVRAFFDANRDVFGFAEVTLDDRGAQLAESGTGNTVELLAGFVERAIATARSIDRSLDVIPPPSSVRRWAARWRARAAELGGRYEPGRLFIHGAQHATDRVDLGLLWTDDPESLVEGTLIRLDLDVPLAATNPSAFTAAAQALTAELPVAASHAVFGPSRFELTLASATLDPAALTPIIDQLRRIADSLRPIPTGPYR